MANQITGARMPKVVRRRSGVQYSGLAVAPRLSVANLHLQQVATVQLVRELNNGNVPAATASSGPPKPYKGLPQKEAGEVGDGLF